jgi:hypothetical protein
MIGRQWWWLALAGLPGCYSTNNVLAPVSGLAPPTNLQYVLEPSGDPASPAGLLLAWDNVADPNLSAWNVYSRGSMTDSYVLRGTTTSNTFHDNGIPHLQYYVTAVDVAGLESGSSNVITIDERLALAAPQTLSSTSLNGAIALTWSDNPFLSQPNRFQVYRVYSTDYDLDQNLCGPNWALEGTTVAPEFVAGALVNGLPRCFGVSAVSLEGYESLWSPIRNDTPRPDARNVVLYARQVQDAASGFRFWTDGNNDGKVEAGELGLVGSGSASNVDFSVEQVAGGLSLVPVRTGTGVIVYGTGPVDDLTSIDFAPDVTYSTAPVAANPGWGYVFEMNGGDGFLRFGGVRVTHVGQTFLIMDWSYQTDPGDPELVARAHP